MDFEICKKIFKLSNEYNMNNKNLSSVLTIFVQNVCSFVKTEYTEKKMCDGY